MEDFEAEKKRVEEKIKQRRTEREERERKEEIEREKKRRETGSEIVKTRELIEQQERIRLAEEFRKEKLERERHKKSVLEQIKADREAMKRDNNVGTTPPSGPSVSIPVASTSNKAAPNKCKLAIRLPNGQSITHDFTPNEQLAAVRLFISLNRKDMVNHDPSEHNFSLILPPSRSFSDEDYNRTLLDLGLCPSSRLIVQNLKKAY